MNQNPDLKGWQSYLLWEGLPFLLLLFIFGLISAINWDYECKLISLDHGASDWTGVHLGPILLAMAIGLVSLASFILFIVRITGGKSGGRWSMFFTLIPVTILLIFPSIFIIILSPAAITMMEQMRTIPR